jgi:hypothetical protein
MLETRTACWFRPDPIHRDDDWYRLRLCRLQLFQPQFQLVDLARQLLRRATKLQPAQFGDEQFQLIDLSGIGRQFLTLLNTSRAALRRRRAWDRSALNQCRSPSP